MEGTFGTPQLPDTKQPHLQILGTPVRLDVLRMKQHEDHT